MKRKRDVEAEAAQDPKLQEFLQVMQGPAKSKTWANQDINEVKTRKPPEKARNDHDDAISASKDEPARKQQKTSERDPILEKKVLGKKPQSGHEPVVPKEHEVGQNSMVSSDIQPTEENTGSQPQPTLAVSDRDWLRSKTSRLLGLLAEDEEEDARRTMPATVDEEDDLLDQAKGGVDQGPRTEETVHKGPEGGQPTSSEVLQTHSEVESDRLFIRNLSYTATTDDLRDYFSAYGDLTSVRLP